MILGRLKAAAEQEAMVPQAVEADIPVGNRQLLDQTVAVAADMPTAKTATVAVAESDCSAKEPAAQLVLLAHRAEAVQVVQTVLESLATAQSQTVAHMAVVVAPTTLDQATVRKVQLELYGVQDVVSQPLT